LVKFLESLPDTVIIEIDGTRLIVVVAVFEGLGVSVVDSACNLVTSTLETRRCAWIGACIVEISTIRRANLRAARAWIGSIPCSTGFALRRRQRAARFHPSK
jgi:hypothetical protein